MKLTEREARAVWPGSYLKDTKMLRRERIQLWIWEAVAHFLDTVRGVISVVAFLVGCKFVDGTMMFQCFVVYILAEISRKTGNREP